MSARESNFTVRATGCWTFGFDRINNSIGSLRNDEGDAVDNVG